MLKSLVKPLIILAVGLVLVFGGIYLLPWNKLDWGTIRLGESKSITVTGTAKQQQVNEIARFSASVVKESKSRMWARDGVNKDIQDVIDQVKEFGIEEKDIKTQFLSLVDRGEKVDKETRYRASNSVEIILRDVNKASELADLLNKSKATGVYGPNLGVDDTEETQLGLTEMAITAARSKAEVIAAASGGKLGKVLKVSEGERISSRPRLEMLATDVKETSAVMPPVETGSTLVQQSVTVTFELK